MAIFGWIYENLIYRPQLNLLEMFYRLTGDVGWSIILLALVVNLTLWPLFGRSYLNTQKLRLLQPQIKAIQERYKHKPQQLLAETRKFYQKHNIKNSTTFLILIFQILFATGLYRLTTALSQGRQLVGLYTAFFGTDEARFGDTAFGFLKIGESASNHVWLATMAAILSYLMGMYLYRWAPKPALPVSAKVKKPKSVTKSPLPPSPFDPEEFQKNLEFQSIYIYPFVIFVTNYFLTVGVAIYFVTVNALALTRQIFLVNFYRTHVDKLIEEIAASDPQQRDQDPTNNLEADLDPTIATSQPIATVTASTAPAKARNQVTTKHRKTKNRKGKS